jgi:hypothetical protein
MHALNTMGINAQPISSMKGCENAVIGLLFHPVEEG